MGKNILLVVATLFYLNAQALEKCNWDKAMAIANQAINDLAKDEGASSFGNGPSFANNSLTELMMPFVFNSNDSRSFIGLVAVDLKSCEIKTSSYGDYSKKPVRP